MININKESLVVNRHWGVNGEGAVFWQFFIDGLAQVGLQSIAEQLAHITLSLEGLVVDVVAED